MTVTLDVWKLRKEIKARGILVKDLAKKIGVTKNTLSSFLNGKRALGSSAQILLLKELKVKASDFAVVGSTVKKAA